MRIVYVGVLGLVFLASAWGAAPQAGAVPVVAINSPTPAAAAVELRGPEVVPPRLVRALDLRFLAWTRRDAGVIALGASGLVLGDFNGEVRKELRCPGVSDAGVVEASVSPDGRLAGVLLEGGDLCVWDLQGTPNALGLRTRGVDHFALGVESVALGYDDGRVEVRDVRSGRRRWQRNFHLGGVTMVRFDSTGDRLAFSASRRGSALVDPRSGRLMRAFGQGPAWSIAFDDAHARIAAGLDDGRVSVVSTKDWQDAGSFQGMGERVLDVDFAADGQDLAVMSEPGSEDGAERWLTVWNFPTAAPAVSERMPPPGPGVEGVFRFTPHGSEFVADNGAGWGRVWLRADAPWRPFPRALARPPFHRAFPEGSPALPALSLPAPIPGVDGVAAFVGGSGWLVQRPREEGGMAWGVAAGDSLAMLASATGLVGAPVVATDGARILGRDAEGALTLWDSRTGAAQARIAAPRGVVDSVRGRLVIVGDDGRLYAALPGEKGFSPVATIEGATAVSVDPARPQRMVVGLRDGAIRFTGLGSRSVSSAGTGFGERRFEIGAGAVRALAFSANGKRVAAVAERVGGEGALLTVFAEEETESARPFLVLDAVPRAVAFSADGRRVLAWDDWHLTVVDAATGVVQGVLAAAIRGARFTPDGSRVEVLDPLGRIRVVAVGDEGVAWLPRGQQVALSADELRAVVVDGDIVEIWNGVDASRLSGLAPAGQPVSAVAIDPTSRHIAVRYGDGDVEMYDALRVRVERRFSAGSDTGAPWVRFSDDGRVVWTTAGPRTLVAWTIADGVEVARVEVPPGEGGGALVPDPVVRSSRFVGLLPAGAFAAGALPAAAPVAWIDIGAETSRRVYLASEGRRPLAVAPGTSLVAFARGDTVVQANMKAGLPPTAPFTVPGGEPVAATYSLDGEKLAVAGADGVVRVFDDRGKLVATVDARRSAPTGRRATGVVRVVFEEAETRLRTTDAEGWARVWDWNSGAEAGLLGQAPGSVALSTDVRAAVLTDSAAPAGRRLTTGDAVGVVREWDVATGAQTALFSGFADAITALAASSDGSAVLAAAADGTIRILDGIDLHERVLAPSFEEATPRVVFAADGQGFAAVGASGVVRSWDARGRPLRRWRLAAGSDAISNLTMDGGRVTVGWCGGGNLALDLATGAATGSGPPGTCPMTPNVEATASARLGGLPTGPAPAHLAWPLEEGRVELILGQDGRLRFWDVGARQLRATVVALDDGSWVIDTATGRRISAPSVRDGTWLPRE